MIYHELIKRKRKLGLLQKGTAKATNKHIFGVYRIKCALRLIVIIDARRRVNNEYQHLTDW